MKLQMSQRGGSFQMSSKLLKDEQPNVELRGLPVIRFVFLMKMLLWVWFGQELHQIEMTSNMVSSASHNPPVSRIQLTNESNRFCTSNYIIMEYGIIDICTRFETANEG